MSPSQLLIVYCALIVLASLCGGWLPILVRLTHTRMQLALSFVGGAMLGVGVLHLLPHAFYELNSIQTTVGWLLGGFLTMFFIERVFHFHHHDAPGEELAAEGHEHGECDHDHDHAVGHAHTGHETKISWPAALMGLTLHSLLDGIALAAGVAVETHQPTPGALAGLIVFLVVLLHKPFDSMTLGTLLAVNRRSKRTQHWVNGLYALTVPLGVVLFQLGVGTAGGAEQAAIGSALAFAAGMFLCISTSDLLPELQFHTHDRFKLSAALLLGIALSALFVALEESQHQHGAADGHHGHAHGDHGHQH